MRTGAWLVLFGILASSSPYANAREGVELLADIQVPARTGLTVEVPLSAELRVDSSPSAVTHTALSVQYRGAPVPCVRYEPADELSNTSPYLAFTVHHSNRHSPYLVYQLVRVRTDSNAPSPSCRRAEAGDDAEDFLERNVGRLQARANPRSSFVPRGPPVSPWTWETWSRVDYMILTPRAWIPTLRGLIALREETGHRVATLAVEDVYQRYSDGNPSPEALQSAISALYRHTGGTLRYVLLVGDVERRYEPAITEIPPVPAFYAEKVPYPGYTREREYPTDHLYASPEPGGEARLAVGRLPVRSRAQLAPVVVKILGYERSGNGGDWRRRLLLFGGPPKLGPMLDQLVEQTAARLLNDQVPYDYDIRFTFAQPGSPYTYRLDDIGNHLVRELNEGALFAAYVGHGLSNSFDVVRYRGTSYRIGSAQQLADVSIPTGKPVFLSFACDTGAFDRVQGQPSLAEMLTLKPAGPIGVFAASRSSHPYPNALYAKAFIEVFLDDRPPTLGDGLLALRAHMVDAKLGVAEFFVHQDVPTLKQEHVQLYNLLGDPALRLRYPAGLQIHGPRTAAPGEEVPIQIEVDPLTGAAEALLTLETERSTIRGELIAADAVDDMPTTQAFEAMTQNYRQALDKIVSRSTAPLVAGRASTSIQVPHTPGVYIVKALVHSPGGLAAGHTRIQVQR